MDANRLSAMPENPHVTFIHSLFRSGSTYMFHAVRRANTHVCFQEALHELVAINADNPSALIANRNTHEDAKYRHPVLSAPYYAELVRAWPAWQGKISMDNIYKEYFRLPGQSCGQEYWRSLAKSYTKPVLFQETRTAGRIGSLKSHFKDSFSLYLARCPRDQWLSYKIEPYFDSTIMTILDSDERPASCVLVISSLGLDDFFEWAPKNTLDKLSYYRNSPIEASASYLLFFTVWALGALEAIEHADEIMLMNRINHSNEYREEVVDTLARNGINIVLDDFSLPASIYSSSDSRLFEDAEERVYQILLRSGWSQCHIEKIKEMISSLTLSQSEAFNLLATGCLPVKVILDSASRDRETMLSALGDLASCRQKMQEIRNRILDLRGPREVNF
mgnify:CR=1 FL=1